MNEQKSSLTSENAEQLNGTTTAPTSKQEHKSLKDTIFNIVFCGVIALIVYNAWYIPSFLPGQLYEDNTIMISDIRESVYEHFYSEELGTEVYISYASEDFDREYVSSRERLKVKNDIQEFFLDTIGFKNFLPIYNYDMIIPVIVDIPSYDIVGMADVELNVVIQAFSGLGYIDMGVITYDSELFDLSEQLETQHAVPAVIEGARFAVEDDPYGWGTEDIIIVAYDWTNTTEDYTRADFSVSVAAFQDNVKLNSTYFVDDPSYDQSSASTDIAPGTTIRVEKAFYLYDSSSPVTFEIEPWLSLEDNPPTISDVFELY